MVDIPSHRIVDMIPSREYEAVRKWLECYPNLQIIARDGSIIYHNAITDSHPKAIQISDRFHLLKNLKTYGRDYLIKQLKQKVVIPTSELESNDTSFPITQADENRTLTLLEKYDRAKEMAILGYPKTRICKSLNMDIRVYEKLVVLTPEGLEKRLQTFHEFEHEENVHQKMAIVEDVRKLHGSGFSKREICRRTGLAFRTVERYLDENFSPVHLAYGKKKSGMLLPYLDEIEGMAEKGIMGTVILQKIREKGYSGSVSNVKHHISDWKRHHKKLYDKQSYGNSPTQILETKRCTSVII